MTLLDNAFGDLCILGINAITWLCKDITKFARIMHICFLSDDILVLGVTFVYIIRASALHAKPIKRRRNKLEISAMGNFLPDQIEDAVGMARSAYYPIG